MRKKLVSSYPYLPAPFYNMQEENLKKKIINKAQMRDFFVSEKHNTPSKVVEQPYKPISKIY